ncbi:MAG: UPF0179 family protein [Theionarchaea archaeon]|nr:UPF0179 family protein [Theionarchaea archaeon]
MITLVSSSIAKKGYTFIHEGETPKECRTCRLKATCIDNLERGRRYTIADVRKIEHPCLLGGTVTVVEVSEPEIVMFLDSKLAFEGMSVIYRDDCEGCEIADVCMPIGLKKGDKIQITEILGDAPCKKNKMKKVAVKRIEVQYGNQ